MSLKISFHYRFQKACVKYGVPDVDLFQTTDLWDQKNIFLVTQTIFAVGRTVRILRIKRIRVIAQNRDNWAVDRR